MSKKLQLSGRLTATANIQMYNRTALTLWNRFTLDYSTLTFIDTDEPIFRIGSTPLPERPPEKDYTFRVDENGIALTGRDYGGLMRGFMALLMKIEHDEKGCYLPYCEEESQYTICNRMLHLCVFPENDLYFIKKLIRLAGLCQYTHIVIEFWGMLQYDCLKELAWPQAFTKEQARELIREVRELGMEPIPMFNQLGHATASRLCYGKHVVLDQNPRLQHLFTPDGWAWNMHSDAVHKLLADIRHELYELFGDGEYMHLGCDEAYYYTRNDEERGYMPVYMKQLTTSVAEEGRRPMLWMDMFLEKGAFPHCYTVCPADEVDTILSSLHPATVAVDWQYDIKEAPVTSAVFLHQRGFNTVGAPWYDEQNYKAHIRTVTDHNMHGIMLTTWHTLKEYMYSILGCAKDCGASTFTWSSYSGLREETATLLRRVSFEGNTYADCGWSKEQIHV